MTQTERWRLNLISEFHVKVTKSIITYPKKNLSAYFLYGQRTHYNNSNTAGLAKCNFSCLIDCKYMYCFASCLKIVHSFNIVGGELQNFGLCSDAYGLWAERYHYRVTPAVGGIFNIVTVPRSPHHSLNSCPILSM